MRRGYHDPGWLKDDNSIFIGVNLGWDFTAEHEWGIKDTYYALGISDDPNVIGIERRRITKVPEGCLRFLKEKKSSALIFQRSWYEERKIKDFPDLSLLMNEEFAAAWSGDDFGIHVAGEYNIACLKQLHQSILEKDVAIWLGGRQAFGNSGLCLAIISRIPEKHKEEMVNADIAAKKLQEASDATGIVQKIDELNKKSENRWNQPCGYYALRPSWVREDFKNKTKHEVIYWLNPAEQQKNQFGWYTVEELELWLEGKGPVKEMRKVS